MSLIKSISGIRGTIGGSVGDGLTPVDVVSYVSAFGQMILDKSGFESNDNIKVIVGRDARTSGPTIQPLVSSTLCMMGINVIDLGLATTPTVEMAVTGLGAHGGIILTASHNPGNWNALKLLNSKGEFFSAEDGEELLNKASTQDYIFSEVNKIGRIDQCDYLDQHIQTILNLPLVRKDLIEKAGFKVVLDAVNSVGGFSIPAMLRALGVNEIICINCEPDGLFSHNPEPIPENLQEISSRVKESNADLGIVVDPDVDRLALVCENGEMFGEEYTLVAVSDYILSHTPGSTVSNLSSSRALRDITLEHKCEYYSSSVGEVNVVSLMKEVGAVIGGEGNGGIIYPELHYGRDALVGVALLLSHMALKKEAMTRMKAGYPQYFMAKKKITLENFDQAEKVLELVSSKYRDRNPDLRDGVKIDFDNSWIHIRKSNTEPILRIYSEAKSLSEAENVAAELIKSISGLIL